MSLAATRSPGHATASRTGPSMIGRRSSAGSLTVWVTAGGARGLAAAAHTGQRGRPRDYSEVAIETGHLLRLAFGRPWRQTEGLLRSIVGLLGLEVGVSDHTTFARRSPGLVLATALARAQGERRAGAHRDRRDRAEGAWRGRVAGREARRAWPAGVAQAPPRGRSRQRRDPRLRADEQRGGALVQKSDRLRGPPAGAALKRCAATPAYQASSSGSAPRSRPALRFSEQADSGRASHGR